MDFDTELSKHSPHINIHILSFFNSKDYTYYLFYCFQTELLNGNIFSCMGFDH